MSPRRDPYPENGSDERYEKAVQALTHGNAPRKALEHYRSGNQDLSSVVKSVMHYFARGRDDVGPWYAPVEQAIESVTTPSPDKGEA
jgi:hypothetical protein